MYLEIKFQEDATEVFRAYKATSKLRLMYLEL